MEIQFSPINDINNIQRIIKISKKKIIKSKRYLNVDASKVNKIKRKQIAYNKFK